MYSDIHPDARRLNDLTQRARLRDAYRLIHSMPPASASVIALEAGFSVISTRDRDAFWMHLQRELVLACKARTDGFGLRRLRLTATASVSRPVRRDADTLGTTPSMESADVMGSR